MQCPRCQQDNPVPDALFCPRCGTPLKAVGPAGPPAPSYAEVTGALSEALEQQAATAEILRVISQSPTDVQPVFDAIVQSATRLCDAAWGAAFRFDGRLQTFTAGCDVTASELEVLRREFPRPLTRDRATGRAIADRRVVNVADLQEDPEFTGAPLRAIGFRSVLAVPMLRDGESIGVLGLWRREVRPFTEKQIQLITTFADQAVIAIENVRLFRELQDKNKALTEAQARVSEALEQQTATAEILRVISSSPTDVQPVFDTIVQSAARLCHAANAGVFLTDGRTLDLPANYGSSSPEALATIRAQYPRPLDQETTAGVAILTRSVIHVPDIEAPSAAEIYTRRVGRLLGVRSMVAVPMLRKGEVVGAINLSRQEPDRFSDMEVELLKTFADQAVIAIENVRLFKEIEARNRDLTEALDQQMATSEILRVISSSPTDLQPVFDAIVRSAQRLLGARTTSVFRRLGDEIHLTAFTRTGEAADAAYAALFPMSFDDYRERYPFAELDWVAGTVIHVPDVELDMRSPEISHIARGRGFRSLLQVPMRRQGQVIGLIGVTRREAGAFADDEIKLLQTFADQAVIAIENVRLFTELQARNRDLTEALDQQTATAGILRVISASPTDVGPVFRAIVRSATRLCDATFGTVFRYDGELITVAANQDLTPEEIAVTNAVFPAPATRGTAAGRAIVDSAVVHISDIRSDPDYVARAPVNAPGYRTALAVPMLREGSPLGVFVMWRREVRPFTNQQIELVKTFADQAVIAIENVRLFKELETRNRDLMESLDQQTATSEILRVISSSPTDVQPVFDTLAESAARLCESFDSAIWRRDSDRLLLVAHHGPISLGPIGEYSVPLVRGSVNGRAMLDGRTIHVADVQTEGDEFPEGSWARERARRLGHRTMLSVPLMRGGVAIGTIALRRAEARLFTETQVALLKTFADQAVIAIENVRLFTELQQKNQALTRAHAQVSEALEQQTATAEILRVISSSPTDLGRVLDAVAERAARLCNADDVNIHLIEGEILRLTAKRGVIPTAETRPIVPTRHIGRAVLERRTIHVHDMRTALGEFPDAAPLAEVHTALATPLLREGDAIGVIQIRRLEIQPFSEKQIKLLETFADQAVIAIENVRLFRELQASNKELTDALDQQTATSEILRAISSSPTNERAVFDAIVRSAVRLCNAATAAVFRVDAGIVYEPANYGTSPERLAATRARYPRPLDMETTPGVAILTRSVFHVPDTEDAAAHEHVRQTGRLLGVRSVIAVPMLRETEAVGALVITRSDRGQFSDAEVELLKTFSDQAVIAIENARLFQELRARTAALTRSVDELTALAEVSRAVSSTLDLETVLQTIVSRAVQIADTAGCTIWEYDDRLEEFRLRASHYADAGDATVLHAPGRVTTIRKGQGMTTLVMEQRQPVQIPDIASAGAYESPIRGPLIDAGHRALLGVPLMSEDEVIGVLAVTRKAPGEFEPEVVRLLSTFATQSALAIQNARLFLEIEDKSRQLEVVSQHKSEFLANMSHELRTPLNAIIGFSEVLLERMFGEVNEKQVEYLQDILESGRHLLSLINDILDLSKIEAGRMELELTDFNLPQAIDNAVMLVRERAERRGIALNRAVDGRLGQIRGDERKIRQVVLNLLSNAIKFTSEGGRIEVRAVPVEGSVEVSVTDTGVGIAPEDQEAVFEEFRQVGGAERKAEGTGLGLTLCRKFVELHGGKIWVKSQVGVGSTFTFAIPVRRGQ